MLGPTRAGRSRTGAGVQRFHGDIVMRCVNFSNWALLRFPIESRRFARFSTGAVALMLVAAVTGVVYAQCNSYTGNGCWYPTAVPCSNTVGCFNIPSNFIIQCSGSNFNCTSYMNSNPPSGWNNCGTVPGAVWSCTATLQPCGNTIYYQNNACTPHNLCAKPIYNNAPAGSLTWCLSPNPTGQQCP